MATRPWRWLTMAVAAALLGLTAGPVAADPENRNTFHFDASCTGLGEVTAVGVLFPTPNAQGGTSAFQVLDLNIVIVLFTPGTDRLAEDADTSCLVHTINGEPVEPYTVWAFIVDEPRMSPDPGVEPGGILIADEARATFSYSFSYDLPWRTCDVTYDIWVSVLVGKSGSLAPGEALGDISRLYANNNIVDTCFGGLGFFEGEVALDSGDVKYVPLESFTIEDVYVDIRSEYGYVQMFRLDLTWTATSDRMHQGYDMGRPPTVFQVENLVWADVTGTFEINYDLLLPGEPWRGEISRLRQIGPPAP